MIAILLAALMGTADNAITIDLAAAKFAPVNPRRPEGPKIAVLKGDPATGPSDMLMSFGPGPAVLHTHSADYRLVVVKGMMQHWQAGGESAAPSLGPGSYWFQPAGAPHADRCLSDECVMFITWSGKHDATVWKGETR